MLIRLRPHQFFNDGHVSHGDRGLHCLLPTEDSVFRLLDIAVVVGLLRAMKTALVWNIGTFNGETLALLARNCRGSRFCTLDLPPGAPPETFIYDQDRALYARAKPPAVFENHPQIHCYSGDSRTRDWSQDYADMVIIDGGHDLVTAGNDTWTAYRLVRNAIQPCVIWHDYGNPAYHVTELIDEQALARDIYHVEETMIAFWAPWWVAAPKAAADGPAPVAGEPRRMQANPMNTSESEHGVEHYETRACAAGHPCQPVTAPVDAKACEHEWGPCSAMNPRDSGSIAENAGRENTCQPIPSSACAGLSSGI